MNKLNISKYEQIEDFLILAGSSWVTDSIWLFFMPLLVIFGMATNLLGFAIIHFNSTFNINMYYYLKIYMLCSFFTCLSGALFIAFNARRYLWYSKLLVNLILKFASPLMSFIYFYANMLDSVMSFDKLGIFIKKISYFNKKYFSRPRLICFILFLYCTLLSLPIFFAYAANEIKIYSNENHTFIFTFYEMTEYGKTEFNFIITIIQFVLKDIIPSITAITLNGILMFKFIKYMKNKRKIILKYVKQPENVDQESRIRGSFSKLKEIKTVKMVLLIGFMSFLKTALEITSYLAPYFDWGKIANFLWQLSTGMFIIASFLNYFIVLTFDKKFKIYSNKFFVKVKLAVLCKR